MEAYWIVLLFLGQALLVQGKHEGYTVISTTPRTLADVSELRDIIQTEASLWEGHLLIGHPVNLMVSPEAEAGVHLRLRAREMDVHLEMDNVQEYLEGIRREANDGETLDFDIDDYNNLEAIQEELVAMAARCPEESGVICDLYTIGQSYEGRDLTVLRIRQFDELKDITRTDDTGKNGHWIDSLIHSGEWLGGATHLKIIDHMTRDYETDATVAYLIDTYDWYFLPVMNPDGYEFTWYGDNQTWRKSRNPNEGSECIGTDLNRNYDFMWMNVGASTDPCSGNNAGSGPGSEPETQAVQDEANRLASKLLSWTSVHTSGRMWMHSWGHVDEAEDCIHTDDHDDLYYVATAAAEAVMATHDTTWTWGNVCETIYPAAAITIDYVKGAAGVKYTFTPELRSTQPPPSEIQVSYEEIWNGVVAMVTAIEEMEELP